MKRLLLSLCLVPVLSFAANEPLQLSQTAVNYCDITGDILNQAYFTEKSEQSLVTEAISQIKSKNVDLTKLKSSPESLQQDLKNAIKGIRDNKANFSSAEKFTKSLQDSINACKIQTELLIKES